MFLVDLGSRKVTVEFRHKQFPIPVFKEKICDRFMNAVTTCVIHDIKGKAEDNLSGPSGPHPNGVRDATLLMSAAAICKFPDTFVKETGRKISLTRALKNGKFSRQDRIKIWFGYWVSLQSPLPKEDKDATLTITGLIDGEFASKELD